MKHHLLPILFFTLVACGGGGGGGGSSASSGGSSSSSWTSSLTTSQADVYRTTEYNNQSGLETIHAAEAYASLNLNSKTVAGSGIKISFLDTGVQINHNEISGNYSATGSYDYVNSDSNPSDDQGHGTMTASIAAGVKGDGTSGMHGVAYNSTIISIKVLNSSTPASGSYADLISGINKSISDGVKVINMSLGGSVASSSVLSALVSLSLPIFYRLLPLETVQHHNPIIRLITLQIPAWLDMFWRLDRLELLLPVLQFHPSAIIAAMRRIIVWSLQDIIFTMRIIALEA